VTEGAEAPRRAALRRAGVAAVGLLSTVVMLGTGLFAAPTLVVAQAVSKPVPLVVYSAQGYDSNTVKAFQKATGIPTQLVDDSTGPLLTRIQAEKNNPKWGVLWVDGDLPFAALDQQHMLLRGFEPNVKWDAAGKSVLPKDESYIPTGLTMAAAVVYDSSKIKTPPTSWSQLTEPQYKGLVGMDNPAVSGPTYPYVAGIMQEMGGVQKGESYFNQLKANGLVINDVNGDTLHALQTGQIDMATIQSSAILGAMSSDPNLKIAFPKDETLLPSVIGIDGKASKQEQAEAKRFAEFVLSRQGQHQMQTGDPHGDSLYWPVLQGVNPLPAVPPMSSITYQHLNATTWGDRESSINQWFTANVVS